jgi:hypothetical protein
MSQPIRIPPIEEITQRIHACREELTAFKKLQRLAQVAQLADAARERRHNVTRGEQSARERGAQ